MLRKFLQLAVVAIVVAVAAGFGWLAYGEVNTSEAVHFDESISMVRHQTESVSVTLVDTGAFVDAGVANITDVSLLLGEWTPRYNGAQSSYQKFDSAIAAAEVRAEAYFASQRALTGRYHDPVRRARAQANDDANYALYTQWRSRAHQTREHARNILKRLDDMDTDLRKLELSSEFSFDAGGFDTVPSAISALDDELSQFQIASENIRDITVSPFEEQ